MTNNYGVWEVPNNSICFLLHYYHFFSTTNINRKKGWYLQYLMKWFQQLHQKGGDSCQSWNIKSTKELAAKRTDWTSKLLEDRLLISDTHESPDRGLVADENGVKLLYSLSHLDLGAEKIPQFWMMKFHLFFLSRIRECLNEHSLCAH